MIKTSSLSSANAQNISQISNLSHSVSMLTIQSNNDSSDFGELLSQLSSQTSSSKSSGNGDVKNTQLSLETSLDKASLKDLNTKLINDILQYFESKGVDYKSSKSLAQTNVQASSLKQETKLKYLLNKLSQLSSQTSSSKSSGNGDVKNTQLSLETSLDKASLKDLNTKLINDILQYFESKGVDYKSSKFLTQNTNKDSSKDKISAQHYNNPAQLIALINSILSGKSDINNSLSAKENFLNTAISPQNTKANDQNKDTESKISSQQNSSSHNAPSQENTAQETSASDMESQVSPDNNQSKTDNISNSAISNTNSKSLLDNPKASSQIIASEPSQNKYIQDSQIKSSSYEPKNQTSTQLNLEATTNYDSKAQNNNTNLIDSKYNQTGQEAVLSYKLNDNKSNAQKTSIDNINQQQSQNVSDKISIDPKSLQQVDQNTTQPASALLKIAKEGQEAQTTVQDKTKADLIETASKNQPQETLNFQTNSLLSPPLAKENSGLSSNMQAIIDKIAQMKNLNPPVIKTVTISVNPPSLGNIDLQVSIDSKKNLTATIDVQSQDLFNALNKNLDSLKDTLQNQGFNISQISLNIKNDGQQSFYQNNQNQQSFNNNFLNFNQGSNNGNSHQQGTFSQTFNQNEQNDKQTSYSIDAKQIISNKVRLNASLIDIDA